ncbi:hypothetical protein DPMN_181021 [Dreissena polymorpha]|uniref:Uncharacterized protein n=1 Tax=Dreissena polymorpha TaxID=45954 RepID=A0A9D4DBJ3_DREPO|nr:hypothetical protein DPMN_181021 [Dreissena polymorpha]
MVSCFQLLDLMHTLHTRASNIFMSWSEENKGTREPGARGDDGSESLWIKCWCPLLQGTIMYFLYLCV